MRIDLPGCGFKNCRYHFDGNCTKKSEYEKCLIKVYDDFPLCSLSGCEAASNDCHKTCRDSLENKKFFQFVDFLGKYMQALYADSNGAYKEALEDLSFEVCKYLEHQGIQLNRGPLTAEYLDSNDHRDFLRGEQNENL
jgi:hypothetical protein